jgi:hypothetical protein
VSRSASSLLSTPYILSLISANWTIRCTTIGNMIAPCWSTGGAKSEDLLKRNGPDVSCKAAIIVRDLTTQSRPALVE